MLTMDYSVGSLADLITGKNTPNKVKVVQKPFTLTNRDSEFNESSLVKSPSKKPKSAKKLGKIKTETDAETGKVNGSFLKRSPIKKEKRGKKTPKVKIEPDVEVDVSSTGKKKRRKSLSESVSDVIENDTHNSPKDEDKPKLKKNKSSKKKNLSSNDADKVNLKRKNEEDGDSKKSPKKAKLSKSEKNAAKRVLFKERELTKENVEDALRTIYVGNIPLSTNLDQTKKKLKKHFRKYGVMASVRFRGIPVADPKTPKKVAAIKSEFNTKRKTVYGYIKFVKPEDAQKAQEENGQLFEEHHLRVHLLSEKESPDESKAIFVGNLSFDAEEDELWKLFEPCGEIHNIRVIRDGRTGMGKGFAYINFVSSDSVQLALELEKPEIRNRELRITLCNLNMAKKNKKKNKSGKVNAPGKPKFRFGKKSNKENTVNGDGVKSKAFNKPFQGSKFSDKTKKKKPNKGELQKKKLVKKIAPKTE